MCSSFSPSRVRRGSACRRRAALRPRSISVCRMAAISAAPLRDGAHALLGELQMLPGDGEVRAIAEAMAKGGWPWAEAVLAALAPVNSGDAPAPAGLAVWNRLGKWAEHAPESPPGNFPVSEDEARQRLAELVGDRAEPRPQQADYAGACAYAFAPRDSADAPRVLLAEAGTGVGKTLGYIAPASVWAEKNAGAVWISTFTRNLQHQIAAELGRLYPDPAVKERRVVVRKGRENYLCLLNFEDSLGGLPMRPQDAAAAGLVARWVATTRDGDMVGGDLPGCPSWRGAPRLWALPTGAANACTAPVRIITAASSKRACGARGAPVSSSPTTPW